MKNVYSLIVSFIVAVLCNCNDEKGQVDDNAFIVEMNFDEKMSIHEVDLIDSLDIVRLDNHVMIGEVNKIIDYNNRLYVLDAFITKSVMVYDRTGNFVKQIADFGQGPAEYLQLTDIFIDAENDVLGLVSRLDKKLMKYSLHDLNLISVEKMPKSFFYLTKAQNYYVGYMNNYIETSPFNLWTVSESLEIGTHFFKIASSWSSKSFSSMYPFSVYEDKLYYIQPYDFNVYCVGENERRIPYKFDMGKNTWPVNVSEYDEVERIKNDRPNQYVENLYMFQETQNHLIVRTVFKHQELLGVYDKKTKKSQVVKPEPYTDKYLIPFGEIIGMDENAIYSLVPAASVKKNIIGKEKYNDFESEYPQQTKNLREKFKNITIEEDDNPFLLIHYLRK